MGRAGGANAATRCRRSRSRSPASSGRGRFSTPRAAPRSIILGEPWAMPSASDTRRERVGRGAHRRRAGNAQRQQPGERQPIGARAATLSRGCSRRCVAPSTLRDDDRLGRQRQRRGAGRRGGQLVPAYGTAGSCANMPATAYRGAGRRARDERNGAPAADPLRHRIAGDDAPLNVNTAPAELLAAARSTAWTPPPSPRSSRAVAQRPFASVAEFRQRLPAGALADRHRLDVHDEKPLLLVSVIARQGGTVARHARSSIAKAAPRRASSGKRSNDGAARRGRHLVSCADASRLSRRCARRRSSPMRGCATPVTVARPRTVATTRPRDAPSDATVEIVLAAAHARLAALQLPPMPAKPAARRRSVRARGPDGRGAPTRPRSPLRHPVGPSLPQSPRACSWSTTSRASCPRAVRIVPESALAPRNAGWTWCASGDGSDCSAAATTAAPSRSALGTGAELPPELQAALAQSPAHGVGAPAIVHAALRRRARPASRRGPKRPACDSFRRRRGAGRTPLRKRFADAPTFSPPMRRRKTWHRLAGSRALFRPALVRRNTGNRVPCHRIARAMDVAQRDRLEAFSANWSGKRRPPRCPPRRRRRRLRKIAPAQCGIAAARRRSARRPTHCRCSHARHRHSASCRAEPLKSAHYAA